MRNFASFLPVLFIILILGIISCTGNETQKDQKKIFESNPDVDKKEINKPDVDSVKVEQDSAFQDTTVFIFDPALDSTESSAQPMRKPTFRHFYNYMKLHKKGPIVSILFF